MKRILISLLIALMTIPSAMSVSRKGYTLVWQDNFDGTALNRDYWNVEINGSGCGNHELQYYIDSPANVSVRDGNLVLTARREKYEDHDFTSGRINTLGKVQFTYGIIEARIKLPATANGLWPAFWMMGGNITEVGWPRCGETDILEMGHADGIADGTQDRLFNGAMHWGSAADDHRQFVAASTNATSLQDGCYHTFTVVWTAERIEMYVDGAKKPYLTFSTDKTADYTEYFRCENFLLLNLAVGGDFPGIHDAQHVTAFTDSAEMLVDYVRVYQPKNAKNLKIKK